MAKTRNPHQEYGIPNNALIIWHLEPWFYDVPFPCHVIWAHHAYPQSWGGLSILLDWDPANPPEYDQIYQVQRDAAFHLRRFPQLIGDICDYCKLSTLHPHWPRWNIARGENRTTSFPTCLAGPAYPPIWTPDQAELLLF